MQRYESHRILGLSVKMNSSSILFINVYFPVACHENYEEYIMCLGILGSTLESHEEDHVCILGDFNATPGSPRFNEICDMLHENNVMFRGTDILPDNTCTHVNNGSQTCPWLDHVAMSDVLSESTVDCHTFRDVACSDHCAITVTLNFDQLPMTHSIERQKAKHINWKFEDAGLKCRFYQRLDSMLGAAPLGLLRVNRGADANRLDDLLTFMSNAILKNGKDIFGMQKPSKFNVPGWNERAKELNAQYREAVSH